ncbi:MAG: SPOR domain-containing protein [Thermoanaerobaculum sp.]
MRYYQLVASGRQLALVVVVVAGLIVAAFFLGFAAGLQTRPSHPEVASVTPEPRPAISPFAPLAEPSPTPEPTPAPELEPTPPPTPTPLPTPTALPTPTPRSAPRPSLPGAKSVWVQVAAVSDPRDAEGVRHRVVALGFRPEQVRVLPLASGKYRVRVGPFPDRESGSRVAARLRREGFPKAFEVRE